VECFCQFPTPENFDAVEFATHQTGTAQQFFVDGSSGVEAFFQVIEINNPKDGLESSVAEAPFWQATVEWHLAPLESGTNASTGAGFLSFVAFARGFAVAGAFADTKPFAAMFGSDIGFEIVKTHSSKYIRDQGSGGDGCGDGFG